MNKQLYIFFLISITYYSCNTFSSKELSLEKKRENMLRWIVSVETYDTKCIQRFCHSKDSKINIKLDIWNNFYLVYNGHHSSINDSQYYFSLAHWNKDTNCYCIKYENRFNNLYSYKKNRSDIMPNSSSADWAIRHFKNEEEFIYSNDGRFKKREMQFVNFLKNQPKQIRDEYKWAANYRGYKI